MKKLSVFLIIIAILCVGCGKKNVEIEKTTFQDDIAIFNIEVSEPIPEDCYITMGADINNWNPMEKCNISQIDDTHYQCIIDVSSIHFTEINYKWTLQNSTMNEFNMWDMVELNNKGMPISNRTVRIGDGNNMFNDIVCQFKSMDVPFSSLVGDEPPMDKVKLSADKLSVDTEREIRIWLPDNYDETYTDKRYPVLYMHDGQGLFHEDTEDSKGWHVDKCINELIREGYGGCIVVGINSSSNRECEMTPKFDGNINEPEEYAQFIVDVVKPYVDKNYNTLPDTANTGIGGSSYGGAEALYMGLEYSDIFGFEICFSPCYVVEDSVMLNYFDRCDIASKKSLPKIYIYCGNLSGSMEEHLAPNVEFIKNSLIERGYSDSLIKTCVDDTMDHNEIAWCKYFPIAFKWIMNLK